VKHVSIRANTITSVRRKLADTHQVRHSLHVSLHFWQSTKMRKR